MMTLSDITNWLKLNTANDLVPSKGDMIDFQTPGTKVYGAKVIESAYFCDEMNIFVEYPFIGYDGQEYLMTGWVAMRDVL